MQCLNGSIWEGGMGFIRIVCFNHLIIHLKQTVTYSRINRTCHTHNGRIENGGIGNARSDATKPCHQVDVSYERSKYGNENAAQLKYCEYSISQIAFLNLLF